ncbi:hypothetical protein [Halalkalibacter flavus]|uniref:hypothetical protein n=1 Tax=Halalkalibacter flavus TaxID=3090668 RepID=UPI002FCBF88A
MTLTEKDWQKLEREVKEWEEVGLPALQAERIAKGKPTNPPAPFLPLPVAIALYENRLKDIKAFIIKYTALVRQSERFIEIDTSKFDDYISDCLLLAETNSPGFNSRLCGAVMKDALNHIRKASIGEYEYNVIEFSRRLFLSIELLRCKPSSSDAYDYKANDIARNKEEIREVRLEVKRLLDNPEELEKEIAKWRQHYEKIKGEY